MAKAQILVVEDDWLVAADIKNQLKRMGFNVTASVPSGEQAVETVKEKEPDLVLMDIVLKGEKDGIEGARQIRTMADIPLVYLTACVDGKTYERASKTRPAAYLSKPCEEWELHATIKKALSGDVKDNGSAEAGDAGA